MTGTDCVYRSHSLSRSYLNHLVLWECVCISALGIQHAKLPGCAFFRSITQTAGFPGGELLNIKWALLNIKWALLNIKCALLNIKWALLNIKWALLNIKWAFSLSLQHFSETFLIVRRIQWYINTDIVKYPLFLSNYNRTLIPTGFRKTLKYQIPRKFVRWEQSCSMWTTDGRTDMTMLLIAFRNFANAPKNGN